MATGSFRAKILWQLIHFPRNQNFCFPNPSDSIFLKRFRITNVYAADPVSAHVPVVIISLFFARRAAQATGGPRNTCVFPEKKLLEREKFGEGRKRSLALERIAW
jgi:hypothetical protein